MMNKEQISAYFSLLGMNPDTKPDYTYEFLCRIQYRHVTSIPYENLDIIQGKPLCYTTDALYNKIVRERRGGYCFELGGLLSRFLKDLGFEVTNYLGRFLRDVEGTPVRHHRVMKVMTQDGPYIVDVGVGSAAPRYPVKLEEGLIQEQFGETYRFEKTPDLGWVLYELHHDDWRPFYSFTEDPQLEIDYLLPSFYCEQHPDSKFNKGIMVAIKTADGRKTLNGREYKVFRGEKVVQVKENLTDDEITACLEQEFGIAISQICDGIQF